MQQSGVERRRFVRIPLNRSILARTPNNEKLFGTTSDVCPEGVGFFSELPLPEGAPVEVSLELEDPQHTYHDFHLTGHVAHCVDTMENGFHIGVHLDTPPEDFRNLVSQLAQQPLQ